MVVFQQKTSMVKVQMKMDHDPPSPEPESPNSSSLPVGPYGMLLFSYCSCIEYNTNNRHLD